MKWASLISSDTTVSSLELFRTDPYQAGADPHIDDPYGAMTNSFLFNVLAWMVLCFLAIVSQPSVAAQDFEQALTDYIVAIEGVRKLKADTQCGYVVKKDDFPKAPYRELTTRLSAESRRSFEAFLTSPQWHHQNKRIGFSASEFSTSFAPELDSKTKCGVWAGYALTNLNNARKVFLSFK